MGATHFLMKTLPKATPRLMRSLLAVDTSLRCAYVGWGRNYRARARIYFFVALGMGLRSDEFARSI